MAGRVVAARRLYYNTVFESTNLNILVDLRKQKINNHTIELLVVFLPSFPPGAVL
jgi:hypothetical protein